jgi:formylglycine-generating enzyme required for sulfatase activity
MTLRITLLIVILLLTPTAMARGFGCDDLAGEPATSPIIYEQHIQPIFDGHCTVCHSGSHSTGLDLQPGISYGRLVSMASSQETSWLRVEPSSLDNSLLFQKINCDFPPVGDRMPANAVALTATTQALIRDWIVQGALNIGDPVFANRFEPSPLFSDCPECPAMVLIPGGSFVMGSPESELQGSEWERPQRTVNVPSFAIGQYAVTFDEWDACVADSGCAHIPDDHGWGRGSRPVVDVSWTHAQEYASWLSTRTGQDYRLPSEAEREYATRAGTIGRFNTGDCITADQANFRGTDPAQDCPAGVYRQQTVPVGTLAPNALGLYETHGNLWEWAQDCWNENYVGAPTDGSAWMTGDCSRAARRGGAWNSQGRHLRSADRDWYIRGGRDNFIGFRVARSVAP